MPSAFMSIAFGAGPGTTPPPPNTAVVKHLPSSSGESSDLQFVVLKVPVTADTSKHPLRKIPSRPLILQGRQQFFPSGDPKMIPERLDIGEIKGKLADTISIRTPSGVQRFALSVYACVSIRPIDHLVEDADLIDPAEIHPDPMLTVRQDSRGSLVVDSPEIDSSPPSDPLAGEISTAGDFTPSRDGRTLVPGFSVGGPTDQPNPNLVPQRRSQRPSRSRDAHETSIHLEQQTNSLLLSDYITSRDRLRLQLASDEISQDQFDEALASLQANLEACGLRCPS